MNPGNPTIDSLRQQIAANAERRKQIVDFLARTKEQLENTNDPENKDDEKARQERELEELRNQQEKLRLEREQAEKEQRELDAIKASRAAAANAASSGSTSSATNNGGSGGNSGTSTPSPAPRAAKQYESASEKLADIKEARRVYIAAERASNTGLKGLFGAKKLFKNIANAAGVNVNERFLDKKTAEAKAKYDEAMKHYEEAKRVQLAEVLKYKQQKAEIQKAEIPTIDNEITSINNQLDNQSVAPLTPEKEEELKNRKRALAEKKSKIEAAHRLINETIDDSSKVLAQNRMQNVAIGADYLETNLDDTRKTTLQKGTRWFSDKLNAGGMLQKGAINGAIFGGLGAAFRFAGGSGLGFGIGSAFVRSTMLTQKTKFDTLSMLEKANAVSGSREVVAGQTKGKLAKWLESSTGKKVKIAGLLGAAVGGSVLLPGIAIGAVSGAVLGQLAKKALEKSTYKVGDNSGAGGTYEERMKALTKEVEGGTKSVAEAQKLANEYQMAEERWKMITTFVTSISGLAGGQITRGILENTDIGKELLQHQSETLQPVMKGASDVIHFRNPFTGVEENIPVGGGDSTAVNKDSLLVDAANKMRSPTDTGVISTKDTSGAIPELFKGANPVTADTLQSAHIDSNTIQHTDTNQIQNPLDTQKVISPLDTQKVVPHPSPTPTPSPDVDANTAPSPDDHSTQSVIEQKLQGAKLADAIKVHKGEGITNSFMRQIEGNKDLAIKLGYKDGDDLHSFARHASKDVAEKFGYYSETSEVRVANPGAAYELKLDANGNISGVQEYDVAGNATELHTDAAGEGAVEKYEYTHGHSAEPVHHTGGASSSTVETTIPGGVSAEGNSIVESTIPGGVTAGDAQNGLTGNTLDHPIGAGSGSKIAGSVLSGNGKLAQGDFINTQTKGSLVLNVLDGAPGSKTVLSVEALSHLDFPRGINHAEFLLAGIKSNAPGVSQLNDQLVRMIDRHTMDYAAWFHNDGALANKFSIELAKDPSHPVSVMLKVFSEDPNATPQQRAASIEMLSRAASNKLTVPFLKAYADQYWRFYGEAENSDSFKLAESLGMKPNTGLQSYEQYLKDMEKAAQKNSGTNLPTAPNNPNTLGAPLTNEQAMREALKDDHLSPKELADLKQRGAFGKHEGALRRFARDGKLGTHEIAKLQKMGVLPKDYHPATQTSSGSSASTPEKTIGPSYSSKTGQDDVYYDPNKRPVDATRMTKEASEAFGKPNEIIEQTKPGGVPATPDNTVIKQTVPGGVPADQGAPVIDQTIPGGVPATPSQQTIPDQSPMGARITQAGIQAETNVQMMGLTSRADRVLTDFGFSPEAVQSKDIFAETVLKPLVEKQYNQAQVDALLELTMGKTHSVSLMEFMSHDWTRDGFPMSDDFKNAIHSLEKKAGLDGMNYSFNKDLTVRKWIEIILKGASLSKAKNTLV